MNLNFCMKMSAVVVDIVDEKLTLWRAKKKINKDIEDLQKNIENVMQVEARQSLEQKLDTKFILREMLQLGLENFQSSMKEIKNLKKYSPIKDATHFFESEIEYDIYIIADKNNNLFKVDEYTMDQITNDHKTRPKIKTLQDVYESNCNGELTDREPSFTQHSLA